MKILITGANGQLGWHLQQTFANHQLYLGDTENYDITNRDLILKETAHFKPDLIIHAAAYTNVDKAEADKELCRLINVTGSANVAEAAVAHNAKIVAISTDYVFPGNGTNPYKETDQPYPLSFYGQTKLEGEQAVMARSKQAFICRTSWLYGGPKPKTINEATSYPFKNFVMTMLRLSIDRQEVAVVEDQIGAPTYAHDLTEAIARLAGTEQYGYYHITNSGQTNWAEFAETIFRIAKTNTTVKRLNSKEYSVSNPAATQRPAFSVLAHEHLLQIGLPDLRTWDMAIADYLSEIGLS